MRDVNLKYILGLTTIKFYKASIVADYCNIYLTRGCFFWFWLHASLLSGNPPLDYTTPSAEHRTEPEYRQSCALGQIIDFASASSVAKDEFGDLVRAAQQVVGEFWRCGNVCCWLRLRFHDLPPKLRLIGPPLLREGVPLAADGSACLEPGLRVPEGHVLNE